MKVSIFNKWFAFWVDYSNREECIKVIDITEEQKELLDKWYSYNIETEEFEETEESKAFEKQTLENQINSETREKILSRYSETDQTNLERKASRIMWVALYEKRDFTADEILILNQVMEADDYINLCIKEWIEKKNNL